MRSKRILIFTAKAVYFFFNFAVINEALYWNKGVNRSPQYHITYVYADSFDDLLKSGKDLGKGIVPNFTPQSIDQTLGSKGLGDQNSIVPYSQEASDQYGAYSSYASDPGTFQGMEPDPNDPIVKFLNDSYKQKEKYDLTHDPTFGQVSQDQSSRRWGR